MRITSERWWRFTQEHCPILVQGCSFWLFGENLEKSDISHASAGKIFSFRWLLSENMWQRCAKMHRLDPNVEFCHCATWDRRGTLKVEEIGGEFSPFLPSFGSLFICLMWLVIFCSLLSLPYQDLGHPRVGQLNHTRKEPRRDIPSPAWMSLLGISRALSLIQLTFGYVSVLWAQLVISKLYIYSRANYVHGLWIIWLPAWEMHTLLIPRNGSVFCWFNE